MKGLFPFLIQIALTATCLADAVPRGILIDRVWSGHPVGFDILTERGHQFIAYFDSERRLTVKGRSLGDANWTTVHPEGTEVTRRNRMSNMIGWDSHNCQTLGFDNEKRPVALYHRFDSEGKSLLPEGFSKPVGTFPGLAIHTEISQSGADRWVLRWETLGPNRDLEYREAPPPSELRLYQFPVGEVKQDSSSVMKDQTQPD